jgi:hypothetical protein
MSLPEIRRLLRHHHDASYAESALRELSRRAPTSSNVHRAREQGRAAGLAFRIAELYHDAQYERNDREHH